MVQKYLYGYKIKSDLELPYIPDYRNEKFRGIIEVFSGSVPEELPGENRVRKNISRLSGGFKMHIPGVANFLAEKHDDNISVIYEQAEGSSEKSVSAFFLGTIMGGIMHLQNELCLHAGSLNWGNNTILIAGDSGSGKSSLLAEMLKNGARFVTDDVSVITKETEPFAIAAGHPNIRLWADAAQKANIAYDENHRIQNDFDKYWIPTPNRFEKHSKNIVSLFILKNKRTDKVEFEQVIGFDKVKELRRNSFRKIFINIFDGQAEFFRQAAAFANSIEVYRVFRPEGYYSGEIAESILQNINNPKKNIPHAK